MTRHPRDPGPAGIRDLAVIGDRHTAALVSRQAEILWYCPSRFDGPGVLAGLLGGKGGSLRLVAQGAEPLGRSYLAESGMLRTRLAIRGREVTVTDWLNFGETPAGVLCRMVSPSADGFDLRLSPRPDYGRRAPEPRLLGERSVAIGDVGMVYASHPLAIVEEDIACRVTAGEEAWIVLADDALDPAPDLDALRHWRALSLAAWDRIGQAPRPAVYGREVADSLRALRLLSYAPSGGMVAAATTSLPEIPGGTRNYDYRYVWLRDAGMIASALVRAGDGGLDAEGFLGFVCSTYRPGRTPPLPALADLDGNPAPGTEVLPLEGYLNSRPVRIGNAARDQLQLDGLGNVLLAARLIYGDLDGERPHWETVRDVADYLALHWREPDHGIWEEETKRHYTTGKVIAACGLDSIADFADEPAQAGRWRQAVHDIRRYVAEECMTPEGAYASVSGGVDVDVSAALFPVWGYADADAPEMIATMNALERDHSPDGLLFRRSLLCADASDEGAFLAGTFWVAHYWIIRGDLAKARAIIDRALSYANDLGLFAEEADPKSDEMLGNFPQTFVHAAFIGAVADLRAAMEDDPSSLERQISHQT